MAFPSPPWQLHGQMWLSLFPVRTGTPERPAGLYGAAFVDYSEQGVLSYRELVVARLLGAGPVPRLEVTDIWVDSTPSRDGARALWAIPKEMATLHVHERRLGPASGTSCAAAVGGVPVAAARFRGATLLAPRLPYRLTLEQRHEDTDTLVLTAAAGSARTFPSSGRWDFGADGPLAWLHGRRPVTSLRIADFRMTFGR